ncbi:hypothetical protein PUNSTDRAFT_128997 [Punctularia strigosozonata HHB-11173 SS5]|uniref:uncharacterized protein n=1 Tax=Punctularia strigosozonata (strain HHB-11173) TaxID=741275 RepID=UPI0004418392|nr:uncharacterized protein PUNSTDRAFT_128997 [Punctularia strigosozonata HHB-11173 SS5]EIN13309.1 hypothetical protein PUNSTDRAFT_128997 [Punctularia strigosozonata HHB-11173 SS5]
MRRNSDTGDNQATTTVPAAVNAPYTTEETGADTTTDGVQTTGRDHNHDNTTGVANSNTTTAMLLNSAAHLRHGAASSDTTATATCGAIVGSGLTERARCGGCRPWRMRERAVCDTSGTGSTDDVRTAAAITYSLALANAFIKLVFVLPIRRQSPWIMQTGVAQSLAPGSSQTRPLAVHPSALDGHEPDAALPAQVAGSCPPCSQRHLPDARTALSHLYPTSTDTPQRTQTLDTAHSQPSAFIERTLVLPIRRQSPWIAPPRFHPSALSMDTDRTPHCQRKLLAATLHDGSLLSVHYHGLHLHHLKNQQISPLLGHPLMTSAPKLKTSSLSILSQ